MSHTEPSADQASPPVEHVEEGSCVACGYDLAGLPRQGVCPECGVAVSWSLRGRLLRYASPAFLAAIHRGVVLALAAIFLHLLLVFTMTGLGIAQMVIPEALGLLIIIGSLGISLMLFCGYTLFLTPDPKAALNEEPTTARQVANIAVYVQLITAIAKVIAWCLVVFISHPVVGIILLLAVLLEVVYFFSLLVLYVAVMIYLRWLAARVPDAAMVRKARVYVWVLPILSTVGVVLLFLGPIIAVVMYWNLLDRFRKHIKRIRAELRPDDTRENAPAVPAA